MIENFIRDRGGTRSGNERRKQQLIYINSDRRTGQDRRSGSDRRDGAVRYKISERGDIFEE